jgi:hypothetical protein
MPPFKLSRRTVFLARLPMPLIFMALSIALVGGFLIHVGVGLLILAYIVRESAASVFDTADEAVKYEYEAYRMATAQYMAHKIDNQLDQQFISGGSGPDPVDPRRV